MGQDFIYSTLPACELTDERMHRLLELVDEQEIVAPPESVLCPNEVDECRNRVREAIDRLRWCVKESTEVADFWAEGMIHRMWLTGCMSWGSTTESMDVFEEVNRFPLVYFQLLDWAKEDFAKNPETQASHCNFVQFCLG